MSKISNKEIEIPEPINKRPDSNEDLTRVEHPESAKINTSSKAVQLPMRKVSRFAPQAVAVEVPSKGVLYKDSKDPEVRNGIIRISQMTAKEEKILTTQRFVENGTALDLVLENCISSNIDPYSLLSSDRLYLLFYLRGMSYGLSYDFNVKCYHCGTGFVQNVIIDKLDIDTWDKPEDGIEPVVIRLPITGATVESHYMRGHEEKEMMSRANEPKRFDEPDDGTGDSLVYLIDKVTMEDGEVLSERDRLDFLENLVAGDCDEFRTELNKKASGIRSLEKIKCPKCNQSLTFNVPLGRNFFRRQRR